MQAEKPGAYADDLRRWGFLAACGGHWRRLGLVRWARKIRNEKERVPAFSGALSGAVAVFGCPGQAVTAWPLVAEGDQGAAQRDQKKGSPGGIRAAGAAFSVAGGA